MAQRHVDILIHDGGLADELAAVLLARQGLRVLRLSPDEESRPSWPVSGLLMERLLEQFGGRTCISAPPPFQLLTAHSRLEFHGTTDLEGELRREFAADAETVLGLLNEFEQLGRQLEEVLCECEAFPAPGFGRRLRFLKQSIKQRLPRRELKRPLASTLERLPDGEPRHVVSQLFAGLTLRPVEQLSTAEAALVWSAAIRPRGISASGLDSLLSHRLTQFHGQRDKLQQLREVVTEKQRPVGLQLKNGTLCTAELYLAGRDFLKGQPPTPAADQAASRRFRLHLGEGSLSEMLRNRVILAGSPTLRITIDPEGDRRSGRVEAGEPLSEQKLRERLTPLLPFCRFTLVPLPDADLPAVFKERGKGLFGLRTQPVLARNLLNVSAGEALPALGFMGEVLWGHALAWEAGGRLKR